MKNVNHQIPFSVQNKYIILVYNVNSVRDCNCDTSIYVGPVLSSWVLLRCEIFDSLIFPSLKFQILFIIRFQLFDSVNVVRHMFWTRVQTECSHLTSYNSSFHSGRYLFDLLASALENDIIETVILVKMIKYYFGIEIEMVFS